MYLLIDAGNSRLKWFYGTSLPGMLEALPYRQDWTEELRQAWHLLPKPKQVAISCVRRSEVMDAINELINDLWQLPLRIFVAQRQWAGLTLCYEKPETLGSDRYLAMLGARSLCQEPFCVVGCGTAITLDAVGKGGRHLGGLILPGLKLSEQALLSHTARLKPMRWTPHVLGTDTASCIGAGLYHTLPAGIDGILDELEGEYGFYFKRFAFGGDAHLLFARRPVYQIEPDLVFAGMLAHLEGA